SRYDAPPMLSQSWALIAPAASDHLIPPGSYASRIAPAVTAVRPWLVWNTERMLPRASPARFDLERIRELKHSLAQDASRQNELTQLIRQTPPESFAYAEALSKAWNMPLSSLRGVLESLEAEPESPAHVRVDFGSLKPVAQRPSIQPSATPGAVRIIVVIG